MKEAGIKVWVLTGDKRGTAINIGFAAGLLHLSQEALYIDSKDELED
jgi:P-type E1-E2 ATPase